MDIKTEGGRSDSNEFVPNSKIFIFFYPLFLVFCFSLFSPGCTKDERMYKESRIVMYTLSTITVVSSSEEKARKSINAGFARIAELEKLLNYFSPESEVTAINRAAGRNPVKISKETLDVIRKAVEIADYTDGAFDPTIGPVIKLWGFSRQKQSSSVPPEDKIKEALKFVDYKKIVIDVTASEIFLASKGMELDLGGIAKGYAADMAIEAIKASGIKAALVAIAGDIKGYGLKPDHSSWKIGIQSPRPAGSESQDEGQDVIASLYLKNKAVSTSGDYQRFFIEQGKRYHHILDPRIGYSTSDVMSVSVIAPHGYMADGLSTGIFVLGSEAGLKLLESLGLDGVIVDGSGRLFITENLRDEISIKENL